MDNNEALSELIGFNPILHYVFLKHSFGVFLNGSKAILQLISHLKNSSPKISLSGQILGIFFEA